MGYGIPPETIERVRSQADIVEIVSEYLTLKKAGSNYRALCPFHKEKTPSFMVSAAKQIYRCFGCGAGGNVFGFLMRQEGFTFPEAVRYLAERMGIQIKQAEFAPEEKEIRERLFDLYEFATSFYRKCLLKSPQAEQARNYLQARQLSGDAINEFSLGYAPGGWDALISAAAKKRFKKELLLQGGLAKKSQEGRVYDTFRNRVIFPIWGLSGKVVAFGGRALEDDQPKYINSPETPIYHKGQTLYNLQRAKKSVSQERSVIVVEGYTDAIRVALSGLENVVASLGTAFTPAQARLLKRYAEEVVLVLDSDSAGEAAKLVSNGVLFEEDLKVKLVVLPSKDPDEFILKEGAEAFRSEIEGADVFFDYYCEQSLAHWRDSKPEEKIEKAHLLISLASKVPDPISKSEYLRHIGSKLDISPEVLFQASQKVSTTDRIEEEVRRFEHRLKHEERELVRLIKLLIDCPEHVGTIREHLSPASIENEALRQVFEAIFELAGERFEETMLFDRVESEEAQQMLASVVFDGPEEQSLYPVEWWVGKMAGRRKQEQSISLQDKIAEAERKGDTELLQQLLREKAETRRRLQGIMDERVNIMVD